MPAVALLTMTPERAYAEEIKATLDGHVDAGEVSLADLETLHQAFYMLTWSATTHATITAAVKLALELNELQRERDKMYLLHTKRAGERRFNEGFEAGYAAAWQEAGN